MSTLADIWDAVLSRQPPPTATMLVWVVGAVVLASLPALWPMTRHLLTIAHEGAHGLVAVLVGRRLQGIRLHSDTSGLTVSSGRPDGPGMVLTLLAGYLGPGLLGLAAAFALWRGHAVGMLWGLLVVLVVLLVQIRNLFGLWVVLVSAAGVFAVSWWAPAAWQSVVAWTVTVFLLVGAPRAVFELQAQRRRGAARTSDPDQLARLTRVPGLVWVGVLLAGTLGCTIAGVWLLLSVLDPA